MAKSIMEDPEVKTCYACGCYATQGFMHVHHIFGGPNRKLSERYGLKVHLCYVCHEDGERGVHGRNVELMDRLHREGQEAFERVHGDREVFTKIFGKNYI